MKTKKYYLSGNGCDTWTLDLWDGNGHFELVKQFKKTVEGKSKTRVEKQRQIYNALYGKAVKYMNELSARDGIPTAGGSMGNVTV